MFIIFYSLKLFNDMFSCTSLLPYLFLLIILHLFLWKYYFTLDYYLKKIFCYILLLTQKIVNSVMIWYILSSHYLYTFMLQIMCVSHKHVCFEYFFFFIFRRLYCGECYYFVCMHRENLLCIVLYYMIFVCF